ncbi:glycoside hydrolase 5 family protein [Salinimicrobium sp. TH3]|uniref:glycoside hydrolase 5 family protein n=1 Tax=Salinimicrobium sp. TH3 TaxID=2997342 RepID=UPI00227446BD|nr:cellulase family glycosylhydrolase [Salinimicrobium sp. TH3]MCY2685530.1 cellulase family glycosylhydrolase [Salinimicrobium sp. TH3]
MKKLSFLALASAMFLVSCGSVQTMDEGPEPITVKDGIFYKGSEPYYFVGANYWYGPLIGASNIGDRERLIKELDLMKSKGIDNLRILVGAEGGTQDFQVKPALQPAQGEYNEDLLDGLDFLLAEMAKRDMYAVLYLNNNWIWSGGMSAYLEWNGYGEVANPFLEKYSWGDYFQYTQQFHTCTPCREAFMAHVKFIIGRTNQYTGRPYTDDTTIMSWQVANEPRIFTEEDREPFRDWLKEVVDLLESLDPNTLISTGAEGKASYLEDLVEYETLHSNPKIDYLTAHMWPKNWGWYNIEDEKGSLQVSIDNAYKYINEHVEVARKLNKPIVLSEFGFPREKESLALSASVENRDKFYEALFLKLKESHEEKGHLAGANFWGFGGFAKTDQVRGKWEIGDDFTGDPPQEPQGLNTVFAQDDSTLQLIKKYNEIINPEAVQK